MKQKFIIIFAIMLIGSACAKKADTMESFNQEDDLIEEATAIEPETAESDSKQEEREIPRLFRLDAGMYSRGYAEGLYCILNDGKYGYFNSKGEEIIPCIYDSAAPFREGLAAVSINDRFGFVNEMGEVIVPLIYDKVSPFQEELAYFERGEHYGFINQKGEEVFQLDYDSVSMFHEGFAYVSSDGKYGYINKEGNEVIPLIYDDVDYFKNGFGKVRMKNFMGIITPENELILPIEFSYIYQQEDVIIALSEGGYGCYSLAGDQILEPKYQSIEAVGAYFIIETDGYGIADKNGEVLLNPIYDRVRVLAGNDLFNVRLNEKEGIFDSTGKEIIPIVYDYLYFSEKDKNEFIGAAFVEGKGGYLSISDGSEMLPFLYDAVSSFTDGKSVASIDGKSGVIDKTGNIIVPFEYNRIELYKDGKMLLKDSDNQYSLADSDGKLLTEERYDEIQRYENCFKVTKRERDGTERYGYLYGDGQEWLAPVLKDTYIKSGALYNAELHTAYSKEGTFEYLTILHLTDEEFANPIFNNIITPKFKPFHQFSNQDSFREDGKIEGDVRGFRLYAVSGSETPILYMFETLTNSIINFSEIYGLSGDEVQQLAAGFQPDSYDHGGYVGLVIDGETSDILISDTFYVRRGRSKRRIYEWDGISKMEISSTYVETKQIYDYSQEEFIDNIGFLYDENDNLYTEKDYETAEFVTVYGVNGNFVTKEEYNQFLWRYSGVTLFE